VLVPPNADFTGTWQGSGKFTNEWASPVCAYEGDSPKVTLEVVTAGDQTTGTLTLDLKATTADCPPLKKHYDLVDVRVSGDQLDFVDPAGASWDLALHAGGLLGIVDWKGGPTDEPLADGFHGPDGSTPLTRLQGEVNFSRIGSKPTPLPVSGKTTTTGTAAGLGSILVANVVGAAVLVLTYKLTKSSGTGTSTNNCSPRTCIIGSVGSPCLCNVQYAQGGSCYSNGLGGQVGASCSILGQPTDTPCANGLSCNNGVCQDFATGQCPPPP
jgi:hypothetical protein